MRLSPAGTAYPPLCANEEGIVTVLAPAVAAAGAAKCGKRSPHAHSQGNPSISLSFLQPAPPLLPPAPPISWRQVSSPPLLTSIPNDCWEACVFDVPVHSLLGSYGSLRI
jgi:hypothetical protein